MERDETFASDEGGSEHVGDQSEWVDRGGRGESESSCEYRGMTNGRLFLFDVSFSSLNYVMIMRCDIAVVSIFV